MRGGSLSESSSQWSDVLREAIGAEPTQPEIGTRFRQVVVDKAERLGLSFPPADEPTLRFIQFLERYPEIVSVLRRPGQDFLVVPAGKTDLLAEGIKDRLYGIRRDLFEAFTLVSAAVRFYNRSEDRVEWRSTGSAGEIISNGLVPIAGPSKQEAIDLRRSFAETIPEPSRDELLAALSDSMAFQAFSRVVKTTGLQREWHIFRTKQVHDQIQQWARLNEIGWKAAWLTETPSYQGTEPFGVRGPSMRIDDNALRVLFSRLDAADLQRISVPLDLVLKVLSDSRQR